MPDSRPMKFQRFGRYHQLKIKTVADLTCLADLDEVHWVATGAPISTINCDEVFLRLVDSDHNGRIMTFELIEAVDWLFGVLSDRSGVTEGSGSLRLDAIDTSNAQGRRIHGSAGKILNRLGDGATEEITLQQIRSTAA